MAGVGKKKIAVLTDLLQFDEAYSVARGARNNVRMLVNGGYCPILLMRKGRQEKSRACREAFAGAAIIEIDYGRAGTNRVEVSEASEGIVEMLRQQFEAALTGVDLVLTHDLIYQANQWEAHVAYRRLAKKRPDLQWLHWVHSVTNLQVPLKATGYEEELSGKPPNSRLVTMSDDLRDVMAQRFRYAQDEVVVIPHPIDFTETFHQMTKQILEETKAMNSDLVIVYPCRLDRGKRPHLLIKIAEVLKNMLFHPVVVIVDFHSKSGDKAIYREEMKQLADRSGVDAFFTSDIIGKFVIPHQVVMELYEVADVLIQPSVSESYSRIVAEAAWKRCGLVLNEALLAFRQYAGQAAMCVVRDEQSYIERMAAMVAYQGTNNSVLALHRKMRIERSLDATWRMKLLPAIEGLDGCSR